MSVGGRGEAEPGHDSAFWIWSEVTESSGSRGALTRKTIFVNSGGRIPRWGAAGWGFGPAGCWCGVAWRGVAVRVCVCVVVWRVWGVVVLWCCGVVALWYCGFVVLRCCGVVASSPLPRILAILSCIVAKMHGNDICLA